MNPICDYCETEAKLVTGAIIYPRRKDLHTLFFWFCAPCDAYVGCHKKDKGYGNGTVPLGRLANAKLRTAKSKVHKVFDPMWKSGQMTRGCAYRWLSGALNIPYEKCHIGMFDVETCEKAYAICSSKMYIQADAVYAAIEKCRIARETRS